MDQHEVPFEERVKGSFGRQRAMVTLGVSLERVAPGQIELLLPFSTEFTQQHGFLHAGIVATVLDSACGYAAFTLMPADAAVLTIEFKTNFLAPAHGDAFRVTARVVKAGRTITVCDGQAFARHGTEEKLVATMTATLMAVVGRPDLGT